MSNEEAIKMLSTIQETVYLGNLKFYESIDVAIKALQQKPCQDTISRQAAIDALEQIYCHIEMIKRKPITKGEQAMFLDMRGAIKGLSSQIL